MNYTFCSDIRDNDTLRESFNELTRKTFGFDFADWYAAGHWTEMYVPHVLLDGDKVIANISVNNMLFEVDGRMQLFLQLGTIMTDPDYRGQGLCHQLMEQIITDYGQDVDGIYLFANDEAVNFYPKFGFKVSKEYEHYMPAETFADAEPYRIAKIDMNDEYENQRFFDSILFCPSPNANEMLYMNENIGLYQFWMNAGYIDQIYYFPDIEAYAVADCQGDVLRIHNLIGVGSVDLARLAKSFDVNPDAPFTEMVLGYTPFDRKGLSVREHKEEDTTLFIMGKQLECIEKGQMMFPVLSHA